MDNNILWGNWWLVVPSLVCYKIKLVTLLVWMIYVGDTFIASDPSNATYFVEKMEEKFENIPSHVRSNFF